MKRTTLLLLLLVLTMLLPLAARADDPVPPAEIPLEDVGYLRIANPLLEKQLLVERFQHAQEVAVAEIQKRDADLAEAIARVAADAGGGAGQYSLDLANKKLVLVTTTTSSTTTSTSSPPAETTTTTVPNG